jgi:hypothetical protein
VYTVLTTKAVAILLTATHLHVPGPQQYGVGPPCGNNPFHELCVGTGPFAYHPPTGFTPQSVIVICCLVLAVCLILALCLGHALLKSRGDKERGWL